MESSNCVVPQERNAWKRCAAWPPATGWDSWRGAGKTAWLYHAKSRAGGWTSFAGTMLVGLPQLCRFANPRDHVPCLRVHSPHTRCLRA